MTKDRETWVVFLDMLGTKESAKVGKDEYPDKISIFKNQVVTVTKSLDCNVTMRLFSDSVYFEIDNFSELATFCSTLTTRLFSQDIFFKGAIARGSLNEQLVEHDEHTNSGCKIEIRGSTFGPSVVPVHFGQETFKGIGFLFDPEGASHKASFRAFAEKYLVRSAYPISTNKLSLDWQSFYDIRFENPSVARTIPSENADLDEFEEGIVFVQSIVQAALRAERSKKDLSRYYLSFLHSLIASADFKRIDHFEDNWRNFPIVFYVLFLIPQFRSGVLRIAGGDTLLLHISERILSESPPAHREVRRRDPKHKALVNQLISELVRNKVIRGTYPKTPAFIFSEETRQFLAKAEVSRSLALKNKE